MRKFSQILFVIGLIIGALLLMGTIYGISNGNMSYKSAYDIGVLCSPYLLPGCLLLISKLLYR